MARRSLLDIFWRLGSKPYDWMYRRGVPWGSEPRPALVELCETGRITVEGMAPGRAIDLGCGNGRDSIFLASQGFDVIGVDFSEVAISQAREIAEAAGLERPPRLEVADLLTLPNETIPGPFDLLFDGGSLDDFPPRVRPEVAARITDLARQGSLLVMWCFYASAADLPRISLSGASRWGAPPIEPGEEQALFGADWEIERFHPSRESPNSACFVMTRR